MEYLLFTPTGPDGEELAAEARLATAALEALLAMAVRRRAEEEGKSIEESYEVAFVYLRHSLMHIYPGGHTGFQEIISTARRLGLTVIPELDVKVVIQ